MLGKFISKDYYDKLVARAADDENKLLNLQQPGFDENYNRSAFIAPHLISTGDELSISLAMTYRTELSDVWTNAHLFNYLLRKLKFNPQPVGLNTKKDRVKANLIQRARALKHLLRSAKKSDKQ